MNKNLVCLKFKILQDLLIAIKSFDYNYLNLPEASKIKFLEALQYKRTIPSHSLKNPDNFNSWLRAQDWMMHNILSLNDINKPNLIKLNSILNNTNLSSYRTVNVFAGPSVGTRPDELEHQMNELFEYILQQHLIIETILEKPTQTIEHLDQFYKSITWICNLLINIHPFADGNGRMTLLLVDYLLGRVGFLPLTYSHKIDFLMMDSDKNLKQKSFIEKNITLLNNQLRSYLILESLT